MIRQPPLQVRAGSRHERWQVAGLCLFLAAITFAVFGQTLTHEFVDFDDNAYVYENPVVARGLTRKGIIWAFTGVHANNWHPLTWLSHMLDCQLYGLQPGGHHLTNVLLHTATVIALFLVLRQMTGALWRSAFVAAMFAIHPLRVESVAWVAERKDVLSGLFFILTIGAYARYARGAGSPVRYGLVLLLFALGLMCKPMLVTLPLVLLLLDYWPLQRMGPQKLSGLVLEKLPLLALSAASCVATLVAQHEAVQSIESYSLPLRFANAVVTGMIYLWQMVYPAGLAVIYPYPHKGLPVWEVALAGTLLAGLSIIAWKQRRKQPWLSMGWLWYLIMLLPVVGIVQAGNQAHADRYTYLPQIGISIAVVWLVADWRAGRIALTAVLAVLMVCAWKQTTYWKNSETLWTRALDCTTSNDMAHYGMGNVFLKKEDWDKAISHYQSALQIKPDYVEARGNLGLALFKEGKTDEAITQFQIALQLHPGYADALFNLGNVFLQKKRLDEAITYYKNGLQTQPDNADAHGNLGIALFETGKVDEAIVQFRIALQIKPNDAEANYNLGNALRETGKMDEAISRLQTALQIKPNYAAAHFFLGKAFTKEGQMDKAIAQYQQTLQLTPNDPGAQNALAWLLATCPQASLRNGNKAVALARKASELAGEKNPIYLRTLAAAFAEVGQFDDARQSTQKALALVRAAGRDDMAKDLDNDLKRYVAGLPWHQ
jgi:tetratricopeptide (TPR) repeat protein